MTTQKIPLAGVIGHPVAHSRSPRLFRYWLNRAGLPGHYIPMDITQDDLQGALETLPKLGFVGVNVTIPHKVTVLSLADRVTDRASLIGAANTLSWQPDGTLFADNTDGEGFMANLKSTAPDLDLSVAPTTVFGAGGAARAIMSALLAAGSQNIRLTNRTRSRAEALKAEFGTKIEVVDWVQAGNALDGAGIVVNTTSLGMQGKAAFRVPLDGLTANTVVSDLVYTPLETDLLKTARDKGCTVVDGLGMLLQQAVPGFERWFGERPTIDDETRRVMIR